MEADLGATELLGQVTFRRPLSKRLVFFDLALLTGDKSAGAPRWVELLVKAEGELGAQHVRDIRDRVKLGDTVRAVGRYEHAGSDTFLVRQLVVQERWRDRHPDTPFQPRPAAGRHAAAAAASATGAGTTAAAASAAAAGGPVDAAGGAGGSATDGAVAYDVLTASGSGGVSSATAASDESAAVRGAVGGGGGGAGGGGLGLQDDGTRNLTAAAGGGGGGAAAAAKDAGRPAVCKYWAATGRCPKGGGGGDGGGGGGGTCRYDHPPERRGAAGAQQLYVRSRRAERLAAAADQGFVHEAGDAAKRRRAAVFADWLVRTYGKEYLNSGSGVLDVAGGRGALTFHLLLRCGVAATLVEPRPAKLSRSQHRELAAAAGSRGAAAAPSAAAASQLPQLRRRFEPKLWRGGRDEPPLAGNGGGDGGGGGGDDGGGGGDGGGGDDGGDGDGEAMGVRELLAGCSLVVGLHPDQATEAILDFALETGKPFALVPCCVFPRLYPHRRLRLGPSPPPPPPSVQGPGPGAGPGEAAAAAAESGGMLAGSRPPQLTQAPIAHPTASNPSSTPSSASSSSSPSPPHHWVPVESYPQLLDYLLQRTQRHGSDGRGGGGGGGSGGAEDDGGGGGGARGGRCGGGGAEPAADCTAPGDDNDGGGGGGEPSWRRRQREWLQLWRLAVPPPQAAKPNPDPLSTWDPDPDHQADPGLDPVPVSEPGTTQRESGAAPGFPATPPLLPPPPPPPALPPPPPPSSATATLGWLEAVGAQWEREAAPLSAAAATTAATAAASASFATLPLDAGMASRGALTAEEGAAAAAAVSARAMQWRQPILRWGTGGEGGTPGSGPNVAPARLSGSSSRSGTGGAGSGEGGVGAGAGPSPGGGPAGKQRGSRVGPAGVARLQFLGANQVVYRLPAGDGWQLAVDDHADGC
ncbi:hypothetical protein PLESTB_000628600 [Pleodorina starrii]|uniref:C3H1-type domain-containing protein n=1 Tax=Pleodorina starrii TaxID=330485 RepID=A0A9W6BII1_9CHLO|nr:hypothetical protein PLESTB_000628600 [Pleodorina starrii]